MKDAKKKATKLVATNSRRALRLSARVQSRNDLSPDARRALMQVDNGLRKVLKVSQKQHAKICNTKHSSNNTPPRINGSHFHPSHARPSQTRPSRKGAKKKKPSAPPGYPTAPTGRAGRAGRTEQPVDMPRKVRNMIAKTLLDPKVQAKAEKAELLVRRQISKVIQ